MNDPTRSKASTRANASDGSVEAPSMPVNRWRKAVRFAFRKLETLKVYVSWIAGSELRRSEGHPKLPDGLSMTRLHEYPNVDDLLSRAEGLSRAFVERALERGDIAAGIKTADGTIIAYVWRTFTEAAHTNVVWVRVKRPTVYGYKAFTDANYRGQRLSAAITQELDRICLQRGAQNRLALIALYNEDSIKAEYHRGSKSIGYVAFFDWGPCRFTLRTPAVKRAGLELFWRAA